MQIITFPRIPKAEFNKMAPQLKKPIQYHFEPELGGYVTMFKFARRDITTRRTPIPEEEESTRGAMALLRMAKKAGIGEPRLSMEYKNILYKQGK